MDKAQQILDWFRDVEVLAKTGTGKLVLKQDDAVLELYLSDVEMLGYDEYLDDIRSSAAMYVEQLEKLVAKIDQIRDEEGAYVTERVLKRIGQAAPFTGKSALNPNA